MEQYTYMKDMQTQTSTKIEKAKAQIEYYKTKC